ncbi:MAG TPA: fibronectin type III-like domain-contianing protein [Verrucomicrobiae bacterium]|nr:fibronectin type III-like domain-contianing protein [Verrucomicrobiae bacterium]
MKGFQRVFLEPGETAAVEFEIGPEQLAFYDIRMERIVEAGEFEIMVGNSSRDTDLQSVILTVR